MTRRERFERSLRLQEVDRLQHGEQMIHDELLDFDWVHLFPIEPMVGTLSDDGAMKEQRDIWGQILRITPESYEIIKLPINPVDDLRTYEFPFLREYRGNPSDDHRYRSKQASRDTALRRKRYPSVQAEVRQGPLPHRQSRYGLPHAAWLGSGNRHKGKGDDSGLVGKGQDGLHPFHLQHARQ